MTQRPAPHARSQEARHHLPLSPRDFHILFALVDGECHGYGLVKSLREQTDGALSLDPANLYRAIQKLSAAGLVEDAERRKAADAADERRRYYRITALGRNVVAAEAERMRAIAGVAEAKKLIPRSRPAR